MNHTTFTRNSAATLAALVCLGAHAAERSCASLLQAKLQNVEITSASEVATGTLSADELLPERGPGARKVNPHMTGMPRFCRVKAVAAPVPKSRIGIELWLPEKWNGKLLGIGNHGFGGNFERGDMGMGLHRHYAVVTTDMGHSAERVEGGSGEYNVGSAKFSQDNDVAVEDFAWRATHEMTVVAKELARLRYGESPRKAYFIGCSNGGRQALREAQQFPADYDGVIAGAPAQYWSRFFASTVLQYQVGALPSGARLSAAKLAIARKGALAACDRLDGVEDGLISDPESCRWDPRAAECKAGDDPTSCLATEEVAAIKRLQEPIKDPATGEWLYDGMSPGSEESWFRNIANLNRVSANYFRYMVLGNPSWSGADAEKANLVELMRKSDASMGVRVDAINPDLAAFRDRGGKLIQYHGWADPAMAPAYSPRYYARVTDLQPGADRTARLARTQDFYRLFMAPGMAHCYGGTGPIHFGGLDHRDTPKLDADHDMLEALDRWVEKGIAPDRVIATEFGESQKVKRQMPLCPYPKVATYQKGDPNKAESFMCKAPGK